MARRIEHILMIAGLAGLWGVMVASLVLPASPHMLNRLPQARPAFNALAREHEVDRVILGDAD